MTQPTDPTWFDYEAEALAAEQRSRGFRDQRCMAELARAQLFATLHLARVIDGRRS